MPRWRHLVELVVLIVGVWVLAATQWPNALRVPPPPPPLIPTVPDELGRLVRLDRVVTGAQAPVDLRAAPGDASGTLFVVEKKGRIVLLRHGALVPEPFLDVSTLVSRGGEQGLLGLAFHPDYAKNHRFFINYTDLKGEHRVVQYTAIDHDRADPSSAKIVFAHTQPNANHNGGNLVFGPDRLLYIGLGDGGAAFDPQNRAQDDHDLLGKMLALDVDAAAPTPVVMAKGLRNPWRYSFDRRSGDLYIADVGQNEWEEIDVVPAGGLHGLNFGWRMLEATHCVFPSNCNPVGLTPPVVEYAHKDGCSITGGFAYRGKQLPELDGTYFYSDYCSGFLRSFRWKDGRVTEQYDWTQAVASPHLLKQISSFGEDADGELYVLSLTGDIWKLARR